jgi:predicted metal-binding transcription factor (methanogenesis marker protein 9)
MLMYLWISKIPKDNTIRDKYLQELVLKSNSSTQEYLTEEEKLFIVPLLSQT